ncbi:MAG TPA: Spy/CpxP family protein refolding chaperone [Terracidiphilus sp.]|nr:Spy/CpxP family protein refolding chaperone [Terracidiphilus sp.]
MLTFARSVAQHCRLLLLLSLFFAGASALRAQADGSMGPPPGGPPPDQMGQFSGTSRGPSVERQLKHLTKALSLTPDQQSQVKVILTDQRTQVDALMKQARASESDNSGYPPSPETRSALRQQMRALHEATSAKIEAVLDDTQKAKYELMEQKRRHRQNNQSDDDMPPPPPPDGAGPPDGGGPPGL